MKRNNFVTGLLTLTFIWDSGRFDLWCTYSSRLDNTTCLPQWIEQLASTGVTN